ncbi:MAG: lysoplasmalogenase [Bacteroidetes bacterium]|nr:lysoplasmalogenase [Bacteroidota bacterium]
MRKIVWILFFAIILVLHLAGIVHEIPTLTTLTKPLLIPVLGFFLWNQTSGIKNRLITLFLTALLFSWFGDLLLMNTANPSFFLYGLVCFLLAQLCYSYFLYVIMGQEKISFSWLLFFPVVIYYVVLISWLGPQLGEMKVPVMIYGAIISVMLLLALHQLYMPAVRTGGLFVLGAVFFVISDTALAINKFSAPFPHAVLIIMLTYGLAQFFLTNGALKYILREKSRHSLF